MKEIEIMKLKNILFLLLLISVQCFSQSTEVRITARGSASARKVGTHDGNLVHTLFTNNGVIAQPSNLTPRGAWKGDNNGYVGDVSPLVGLLLPPHIYKDTLNVTHIDTFHTVVITNVDRPGGGKSGPGGKYYTFEPIPGFYNPAVDKLGKGVAMSHQPDTWPASWPNRPTWVFSEKPIYDPASQAYITPSVDWNGYFGRGTGRIATEESYWWMDDNNDDQFLNLYGFRPDANDSTRSGKAIQIECRGLQWGGDPVAQNVVFWLYNIKNDGTTTYNQAVFGCLVGTYVGGSGDEWNDDASFFDVTEAITYTWDVEPGTGKPYIRPSANPKWVPNPNQVGTIAYAFLESPGNGYDGIDNDRDNSKSYPGLPPNSAKFFTAADFTPRTIKAGSVVILIDSLYNRFPCTIPNHDTTVYSMGHAFLIQPGITQLVEGDVDQYGTVNVNAYDGIDNNLNGLIDENYNVHFRQYKKDLSGNVLINLQNPVQYKDYINNVGLTDNMIDERRDDNIDNDVDWINNPQVDDVGADGIPNTHDFGEGDGKPTHGEPDFDETDIHESDQLGLTSFYYFVPAGKIVMSDNEAMWRSLRPGYYDVPSSISNGVASHGEDGDFMYGSGYFPLLPGKIERFSLALAFGDNTPDVIRTKRIVQQIYNANYTFPSPPETPTLTAVPGDHKVTLYWDHVAEESIDRTSHRVEFEGYKLYRSNVYDFSNIFTITDVLGTVRGYTPLVQYDIKDGITGAYQLNPVMSQMYAGFAPYLGDDSGIMNSYVDSTVTNGIPYFYALTSYTHGDTAAYPRENTFAISRNTIGEYTFVKNTAMVTPNGQGAGFVPPSTGYKADRLTGLSSAFPYSEIINQVAAKQGTYYITFHDTTKLEFKTVNSSRVDTVVQGPIAGSFSVIDSASKKTLVNLDTRIVAVNGDVFEGVRLSFDTTYQILDSIRLNRATSYWNNPKHDTVKALTYAVGQYADSKYKIYGSRLSPDYAIVFSDSYTSSSDNFTPLLKWQYPAVKNINFQVYDVTVPSNPKKVKFAFIENGDTKYDTLSDQDVLLLSDTSGSKIYWKVSFSDTGAYVPKAGDTLYLRFYRPFSSKDTFVVHSLPARYNAALAKNNLDKIKVVPNPYVVTNLFEGPPGAGITGRGDRSIHFIGIPPYSKIHIYTSSGNHVRTLEQTGSVLDGTVNWDLRTKEGLEVAYGVYFYVVEVGGTGEKKTGKIAIIK
jgi:hypothetical protein